ncbi:hypothetical protein CABS01_01829 [Colletotrichum abscissum]|uniref:uncharacterized protein n=1 Tax=Colletotrichum abscissum TaxID=1671311 RepID=UPI0027D4F740|nr:uncharacterized protein CABS01_01829 [Colletotrichum abscissum]KAK1496022.1 hypothetical protein CABS01_01829 [Colletotrichum abscissum]
MDTLLICSLLYLCSATIVPARLLYSTSLPISFSSLHPISLTRVSTCPLPRTNTLLCFDSFRRYLFLLHDDKRVAQRQEKVNYGATRIEIKARDRPVDPWKLTCLSCSATKKDPQTGAKTSPGKKQHPSNGLTPQPPQFANLTPSPHPSTLTTWPSLLCAIQF